MNETKDQTPNFVRRKPFVFIVTALFFVFAFQLWYHAVRTSVTIDEVPHILAGYQHLECGDFGINPEHPPLLKMIAASPLLALDLQKPDLECGSQMTSKYDSWISGFTFLTKNDPDRIVIPARVAASLISLFLATLVFLAARKMFGDLEAVIALALFAFEPNLIAHGSLVTTDMAVSAGLFATVFALYNYLKMPSAGRFLLIGLSVGWTICSKHSGAAVFPIIFLLFAADVFLRAKTESLTRLKRRCLHHAAAFSGIVVIGLVLLWTAYGFRYSALPADHRAVVSIDEFYKQVEFSDTANTFSGKVVKFIAGTHILPESYVLGLADVVATNKRAMYLFGSVYSSGKWLYFPFAFTIKSSIALLILMIIGLFTFSFYRHKTREMMFLIIPSFFFFALATTSKMNIGVRHILPVYAFFIIIAAAGFCAAIRKSRRERFILVTLLLSSLAMNLRNAPNYIAYSNDLTGGTNKTYLSLSDSNVDWGQNLKLVNEYLEKEHITDCWFASFGSGELARVGQPCRLLPGGFGSDYTTAPIDVVPPIIEGTILLSTGAFPPYRGDEYLSISQTAEPIAQIGGSVFVYRGRFEVPFAAAASRAERAAFFVRHEQFENAVIDAREALKLSPNDPETHLMLGIALAQTNQTEDSRQEIETALKLAEQNPIFHTIGLKAETEMENLKQKSAKN